MSQVKHTREEAQELLAKTEKALGHVPLVNQVLSEDPDMFVPNFMLGDVLLKPHATLELDAKTRYLIALAAAAAQSGEYCIRAQMQNAVRAGATRGEVLETLEIASYMCLTRSQSYSFRAFKEQFPDGPEE